MPIKSADEFVNDTLAKEGQTVQPPDIQGGINQLRQQIQAAFMSATGLDAAGQAIRGEMTPEEAQMFAMGAIPMVAAAPEKAAGAAAEEAATQIAKGIRAYHGSPYDFERFDISKIGTGEGAQAYGHGLYFAEEPRVAEEYKAVLTAQPGTPEYYAQLHLNRAGGDVDTATNTLWEMGGQRRNNAYGEAINLLQSGWRPTRGKMYQVNINADPEHFLDWDKPLHEQHPEVQQKLKDARLAHPDLHQDLNDWHNTLRTWEPEKSIKEAIQAGIPGIKYLDQGSRPQSFNTQWTDNLQAGINKWQKILESDPGNEIAKTRLAQDQASLARVNPPTSNYVVFDASLIEILKKYGIAGLITALGARQQGGGS